MNEYKIYNYEIVIQLWAIIQQIDLFNLIPLYF